MRFSHLLFAAFISAGLAYAQSPVEQQFASASSKLISLQGDFALQTECGKPAKSPQRNEPQLLASVCAGQPTSIEWSSPTEKLAGRRIYLETDVRVDHAAVREIIFLMTSFDDTKFISHVGGTYHPGIGALKLSTYIPENAKKITLALQFNQWGEGKASISTPRIFISEQTYAAGEMCTNCKTRLDESLERVRRKFLFADRIDLAAMKNNLFLSASGARNVIELDTSLKEFARVLNEPHTRFLSTAEVNFMKQTMAQSQQTSQPTSQPPKPLQPTPQANEPKGHENKPAEEPGTVLSTVFDSDIGYLRIHAGGGVDFAGRAGYAQQIRSALNRLHAAGAKRWIIDLRAHGGGSTPPLIAAMRPLLGSGKIGGTIAADKSNSPWFYGMDGNANSEDYFSKDDKIFMGACAPTVLLMGAQTSSSAEALVISFKARAKTRFFGEPTSGYSTSVFDLPFSDGSTLAVTNAQLADRNGRIYSGRIEPDEALLSLGSAAPREDDAWVTTAARWLKSNNISTRPDCQ